MPSNSRYESIENSPGAEGRARSRRLCVEAASSSTRGSGWAPSGPASSWECRAAQNRQVRPETPPEEAQEPS
eukprot:scaffold5078_cov63-Phaeocystis_antarctica.AAC.5